MRCAAAALWSAERSKTSAVIAAPPWHSRYAPSFRTPHVRPPSANLSRSAYLATFPSLEDKLPDLASINGMDDIVPRPPPIHPGEGPGKTPPCFASVHGPECWCFLAGLGKGPAPA